MRLAEAAREAVLELRGALRVITGGAGDGLVRKGFGTFGDPIRWWLTGQDTTPGLTRDWLTEPYAEHPTVSLAIRKVAGAVGQLDLEVWPKGKVGARGAKPIEDHWLPALAQQPSDQLRGDQLKEAVVAFMLYRGECFAWHSDIARDGAGRPPHPNKILLLPPEQVRPLNPKKDGTVGAWQWWGGDGAWITIPVEEMTHWKLFNPFDPIRGLAPLRALMIEYSSDHKAATWNRSHLDHNAIPPIVFSSDKPWPQEDRQDFIDAWENKHMGSARTGRASAMPDNVKATVLKLTHQEMEFLEGRRFHREQILSLYGVPPAVAGIYTATPYATSREQMKHFVQTTLPIARYVASVFTVDMLRRYEPDTEARFNTDKMQSEVQSDDFKEKVAAAVSLWGMGFPAADVNDRLDLGMDTSGKPWLKVGFLPFSVTPATFALEAPEEEEPPAGDEEDEEEAGGDVEQVAAAALRLQATADAHAVRRIQGAATTLRRSLVGKKDEGREARWTGLAVRYADIGQGYGRALRSWLWGLRTVVLDSLARFGDVKLVPGVSLALGFKVSDGIAGPEPSPIDGVLTRVIDQKDLEGVLFDSEQAQIQLEAVSESAWRRAADRGASVLKDETGLTFDFNFLDPRVVAYFAAKRSRIKGVSNRVREAVRSTLQEGIAAGETVKELAARVRDTFDVERSRSLTIARTEVAQAFNGGHYLAMRQVGIKFHEWLSSQDDRVRDSHVSLDGEVVAVGERFSNGCLFPGDPNAAPEETINCFLPGTLIGGRVLCSSKALYAGPAREIQTERGHRLAVTPNHPVLTGRGWIPAKEVREGDNLLSNAPRIASPMLWNVDDQHPETAIDDVFQALAANGRISAAVTGGLDFHGDAVRFRDADIDVVAIDREVLDRMVLRGAERYQDVGFIQYAAVVGTALPRKGAPAQLVYGHSASAARGIGGGDLARASGIIHARPLRFLSFGPAAARDVRLAEHAIDRVAGRGSRRTDGAEIFSDAVRRLAGLVAPDRVRRVVSFAYAGPVMDVQTTTGWVHAGGIIAHNCRCVAVPVASSDLADVE